MMDSCGQSHVGYVRSNNEDSFDSVPELGFFVVADGLGGAAAGERASAVTVRTLTAEARAAGDTLTADTLVRAIELANLVIRLEAEHDPTLRGMGTTVTAAIVRTGNVQIVNAGDSRAYRLSGGQLECLTKDHTWVREFSDASGVSLEQLKDHRYRHVLTKAVGAEELVGAETVDAEFRPGDILLLCSDGLHGVLSADVITQCLECDSAAQEKAEALISATLECGAPDNVTVLVVRHPGEEDGE